MMDKTVKIAHLIDMNDYQFFSNKIDEKIDFDFVFSHHSTSDASRSSRFLVGYGNLKKALILNNIKSVQVYIFDIVPLSVLSFFKYLSKFDIDYEIVFIQHGLFSNPQSAFVTKRSLSWYFSSFKIAMFYVYLNDFSVDSFKTSWSYFSQGSWKSFKKVSDVFKLDKAFFFNDSSRLRIINDLENLQIDKSYIIGSFDRDVFEYEDNSIVLLVSQPLYLSGYCSFDEYKEYLVKINNKLIGEGKTLYVLLHPKMKREMFDSLESLYLDDIKDKFKCSKIIGHFSTLLYSIDENIPLVFDGLSINTIENEVKVFSSELTSNRVKANGEFFYECLTEKCS